MEHQLQNCEEYLELLLSEKGQEPIDHNVDVPDVRLPPWFDAELYKKGQKNYFKYLAGMTTGMLVGLVAVLSIPSILKVLICTKMSGNPRDAYRRYIRTLYHVVAWHDFEMKPGTKAWQSITTVRKTHFASRKMCEQSDKITITQRDMALTQFGFLGYLVLKHKMLGIPNTPDVMEPLVHLWRVNGYLMGIKDEFNLCADTVDDTRERLNMVLDHIYRPAMDSTDNHFDTMNQALLDGFWYSDISVNFKPFIHFTKRMTGCNGYEYFKSDFKDVPPENGLNKLKLYELSWWERAFLLYYIVIYEYLYSIPIIRILYNVRMIFMVLFNYYLPILAMFKFGVRSAYVRIFRGKSTEPRLHND